MRDEHNLQGGLPRLRELAGVSRAHLSRSLKASCQHTPTEFVNRLRVERAAILLATTTDEIGEIAIACGFTTLSYFYRRFGERYHLSPRAYRLQAQQAIAPSSPVARW
jgi:AraC-like DNA-binding protein